MSNEWASTTQGRTLVTADAHGEAWTPDDVEFVAAFTDDVSDEELATTLGRSLYAIWAIQHRLRTSGFDADAARRAWNARLAPVVATCPRCFLALPATGACDDCG